MTVPTFLVTYGYVPDMENRRDPYRQEHLEWLRGLAAEGRLLLAGALNDPVDSAVLVFRDEDALTVRRLLIDDPYARGNLITAVSVRPIGLAIGG
jgi:uncharacterized protein YciI